MEMPIWRIQMKIEIAEPGRMTQTGSSLLKLIQNNNMPVLDLLVRESIQNSLDARKTSEKFVNVDYLTGKFDSKALGKELEGITESLYKKYPNSEYDYIAIRDQNTVGLTGEMNYKKVKDNKYGNILKLIYEICKPQEAEGAGGSWGLGKTVYFRIGIGLVVYYSRIKNKDGQYESRLAASYVENETKKDAMIPVYKEQAKRGIAWWGEEVEENITQPVTNNVYIKQFLDIFGIKEYDGEETGTTIIIPYINPNELLSHNQIEYLDSKGDKVVPYWCHSIEDYLAIAVQRWYAPRLNNSKYNYGASLRTKINGKGLGKDAMEPVFKVIQALYNRANHVECEDILSVPDVISKAEGIEVRKYLSEKYIGVIAFTKVSKKLLEMEAPFNKPNPFMYFNCEIRDDDVNKPTVCFTRKPGMIVSYENMGPWTANIGATNKDEYIIGIFVLNTGVQLKNAPLEASLEEYVRRSEMADHTSWSDWSQGSYNPRLVTKIQNGVNRIISREFVFDDGPQAPKLNSGLGKLFGDLLLPPDGFGKTASGGSGGGGGTGLSKKRGFHFGVEASKIVYSPGKMEIPFLLKTNSTKKLSSAGLDIIVDSESRKIELSEWEEKMGLETPFDIESFSINIDSLDGENIKESISIEKDENKVTYEDISFVRKNTDKGTCHGMYLVADIGHTMVIRIVATVKLRRNDIKLSFVFAKEEIVNE